MPHLPPAGSGTIALATPEPVALGDTITFSVTGVEDLSNPRIWVAATQDGVLVYGEGASPNEPLKLGGGSSDWVTKGGPADCTVRLYYILNKSGKAEWKGGGADQGGTVDLGSSSFHAEG